MAAGELDRRVQFLRAGLADDGLGVVVGWSADPTDDALGDPVWASKTDVSDRERLLAAAVSTRTDTRFVVRSSSFTRSVTAADRLICEGVVYGISGIKELGRRDRLEITATREAG